MPQKAVDFSRSWYNSITTGSSVKQIKKKKKGGKTTSRMYESDFDPMSNAESTREPAWQSPSVTMTLRTSSWYQHSES